MRGFVLPWTMQEGVTNETADGPEDFGARNVTMTITDGMLSYADTFGAAGSELVAGEDFTFSSLHLIRPTIYEAVEYDGSDLDPNKQVYYDNGQLVWTGGGSKAYGGTYGVGYVVDDDYAHIPQFTVTAYDADGNALSTQTVDWTGGAETLDVALPEGTDHYEVSVTFGKADENGDYVAAIADAFVIPKVTLNPTEKVLAVAQSAFDSQTDPVTYLANADSMTATYEDGTAIYSKAAEGGDRLRGYSEDIAVIPSKSVKTEVDNSNQVANLTYTAKVEERSNISNSDVWRTAVAEGDIAADTSCTWYDLLPKGAVPDLSSITLRRGDTITDVYTIPNYKGSGRTLLVVKANLTPTPVPYDVGGSIDYYEDVPTITFKATYSYESMRFYGNDIHNVVAYESGNETLGNVENYSGEPDDPAAETHNNTVTGSDATFPNTEAGELEKSVMTDLDPDADDPNFVYAGVSSTASGLSATTAELAKKVMVNNDGNWGSGVADTDPSGGKTAYIGGTYTYRLQATAAGKTQLSDIILYDAVELHTPTADKADYGDTQWKGQLLGVDVSDMRAAGIDAKVYYYTGDAIDDSTDIAMEGDDSQRSPAVETLTAENGWVTELPADTSAVKAIAVDASKNLDGTGFVLEPGETTAAYVTMLAPRGDDALQYVAPSEGGTDADADGSHAYNNGFLWATTTDSESGQATATKLIRMDYTKVGLGLYNVSATKQWDDADDQDGVRPDSVTVHLYRDGVDTGKSLTLDGTVDDVPTGTETAYESASWVATFKGLPYCDPQGNVYRYTIVEDVPDGYTQSVEIGEDGTKTFVNTHTPETVSVSGTKTWAGDTSDVRPGSITVTLYRDGESYRTRTVTADEQSNWSYSFDNLPRYHDQGVAYTYTVSESVEDYVTKIDTSSDATTGDVTADITNTYHPYGDLAISKTVTGATEQCAGKKFPFTVRLAGADGGDFAEQVAYVVTNTSDGTQVSAGTFTNGQTLEIEADQTLTLKDIPKGATYTVIESAEAGYTASSDTLEGTIASNTTSKADFTNAYETEGSVNLSATKTLSGANLKANQFRFTMRDSNGNVVRVASNGADGTATFGALHFTGADNGKTFTYTITEENSARPGVTYDGVVYTATVTPVDNGDGTMTCTVAYTDSDGNAVSSPSFSNTYKAQGGVELTAYKKLVGGTLESGEFSFQLYDEDGNPLYLDENGHTTTTETDTPLTATNDANGIVTFLRISYTQDDLKGENGTYAEKTFTYTAKEIAGTDDTVTYSTEARSWQVTVSDNGDGTLSVATKNVSLDTEGNASETSDLPLFTNTKKPGSFSVQKLVSGENPDPNTEFTYTIKITYPDGQDMPDTLHYTLSSADGTSTAASDTVSSSMAVEASDAMAADSVQATSLAATEADEAASSSSDTAGDDGQSSGADALLSSIGSGLSAAGSALVSLFAPTPAYAQTPAGTGTAYAVLDSDGTLTFIRSNDTVDNGTDGTITDCEGNSYTGTIYTGFEENKYSSYSNVPWYSNRSSITSVSFKDQIKPQALSNWFRWCANLTSIESPENLDASEVTDMAYTFSGCTSLESIDLSSWHTSDKLTSMVGTFSDCSKLKTVQFGENWNTSKVTRMDSLFYKCQKLSGTLDLHYFDTSNVTDMHDFLCMSYQNNISNGTCDLTGLNLSGWDVSNVQNMRCMFRGLNNLTSLDVSGWNTGNVSDMGMMFSGCKKLQTLDVSGWDVSNVDFGMGEMFKDCENLQSLDVSNWQTGNVRDMHGMFNGCESLTTLDVSNWDVSKVEYFAYLFNGCSSLSSLDLSNWDITSISSWSTGNSSDNKGMNYMFAWCTKLSDLKISDLNTTNVTSMKRVFSGCTSLTSLDITRWNTSNVTDMRGMFSGCTGLTSLDVSHLDTSNVTNMESMFFGCTGLASLDVSHLDTSNVTDMSSMFNGCTGLTSLDVSQMVTSNARNMSGMFNGCTGLTSLDVSQMVTSNARNMSGMFRGCSNLESIEGLTSWNTSNVNDMSYMFRDCKALEELDLSNFSTSNVNMRDFFYGTKSLAKVTLGSDFSFTGSGYYSTVLESPQAVSPYTGNWAMDDGSHPMSAADLASSYPTASDGSTLVGTWVWEKVKYPITFESNGGTGSMAQLTWSGDAVTLPDSTFYRLGYRFTGWNTQADGKGTHYDAGATISTLTGPLSLYAEWEEIDTTVTPTNGEFTLTLKAGEKATFDDLPAGATYEVVESSAPGWTVESQSGTSGTIVSNTTQAASFTNTYTPGQTSASLAASKTLDDGTPADGMFSFTLRPAGDNAATEPMPTGTTGEGASRTLTVQNVATGVSFGSMTYTAAGTYTYTIKEAVPAGAVDNGDGTFTKDGVTYTYDAHEETATVTVSDDGEGNLTATVAYNDDGAAFSDTTVSGSLTISKTISGVTSSTKTFDFTVTLLKDAAALTDAYTYTVKNADGTDGTGGTVASGGTISLAGGQTATITGLPAGTAYTVTESAPDSGWTQTASSGTTGTIASNATSEASFTNTYSASGSVAIKGSKELRGPGGLTFSADYEAGDFQFALYNVDADDNPTGEPIQTASNGSPDADETSGSYGASTVEFSPITYTLDDMSDATDNGDGTRTKEFTYAVEEVIPSGATLDEDRNAYIYDGIQYEVADPQFVTVTVTDDGSGTLTTAVSDDTYSFYFENQIEDGTIWLTKTVGTPSPASSDQAFPFTVTLSATGEYTYDIYAPDDEEGSVQTGGGTISNGGATVVTYDDEGNEVTLDCIYLKDGETLYIRNLPVGSTYSFEEQTPSGWTQTSSSNMSGTVTADVYESTDDSTSSISTFAIRVDPDVPTTAEATVTNDYSASGSASFSASKTLTGATLQDNQFAFELVDSSGNVVSRVTNDASGNVDFGTISYSLADLKNSDGTYDASRTFTYTVREVHGGTTLGDVTYDGTTYKANVTVADNGDGTLSTSVAYRNADDTADVSSDEVSFANVDNPKGTAVLQATKDLVDTDNNALSDWGGRTYTFTVTPNDGAPMRTSATGEDLASLTSSAASQTSPTVAFTQFVYTYDDLADKDASGNVTGHSDKVFTYTISETVPTDDDDTTKDGTQQDGVTYTTETHTATVTVSNPGNGVLDTSVVYDAGTGSESTTPPTLTNSYAPIPTTGTILVTKSLSGRDWTDADSFSFTLTAGSNTAGVETPMPDASGQTATVTKDSEVTTTLAGATAETTLNYTGQFGDITFSAPGDYHYTITETIPDDAVTTVGTETKKYSELKGTDGFDASDHTWTKDGVTYDAASHSAVVKVTEDRETGTLSAATYYYNDTDATPATFTNSYSAEATTASIEAWKTMNGLALTEGSYSIQAIDDNDSHDGMTWSGTGTLAKGTVVATGALTAEGGGHGTAQLSQIAFTKTGDYKFKIIEKVPDAAVAYDGNGNAVTDDAGAQLTWADATDAQRSTYSWKLSGVTYDTGAVEATVTVSDNGAGQLTSEVTYSPSAEDKTGAVFDNTYSATGTATLKAAKHLTGRDWSDDDGFTFVLTATDGAPLRTADGDQTSLTATATRGTATDGYAARTPSFAQLTFTYADLAIEDADGNVTGYDAEREFTYNIHEQVPEDATNASVGNGSTKYKDATDSEKAQTGWTYQGITYAADQTVTIKVTDNGVGALVVTYKSSSGEWGNTATPTTFENTYTTGTTTAQILVGKSITGRSAWNDGESYTFQLTAGTNTAGDGVTTPMPGSSTVTVSDNSNVTATLADGTQKTLEHGAAFGEITYEKAGTYLYTVIEVIPDDATTTVNGETKTYSELKDTENFNASSYVWSKNGVTYSTASHAAKVVVSDDGKGNLSAKVYYRGDYVQPIVFSNSYTAENTKASVEATKTVNGTTLEQGTYSIQVIDNNETHNGMEYSGGTLSKGTVVGSVGMTAANKGHAKAELSSITFTAAGEYNFIMREAIPDDATNASVNEGNTKYKDAGDDQSTSGWIYQGVTYDASQVAVTVTVSDNGYGQLQASVAYDGISAAPTFDNSYTPTGTATLKAAKHISGRDWKTDEEFTFMLTANDGAPLRTAAGDQTSLTATAKAGVASDDYAARTPSFDNLLFTYDDLKNADGTHSDKEFTYTVHEEHPSGAVQDDDGNWTYQGITYAADQTVTVKVHDDGEGTLKVTYKNASGGWDNTVDAPDFYNAYATGTTTAELKATKAVGEGVPFPDDTYQFVLVSTRSTTPMPDGAADFPATGGKIYESSAATQDSPTVSFGTITFDEPGEYDYTITEKLPAGATDSNPVSNVQDENGDDVAVVFDTASHAAHVKVTDNGDGTLSATVTYDEDSAEAPTFTNVKGTDGGFSLSATKVLTGAVLRGGQFSYTLYKTGDDWDITADGVETLGTETNKADGSLTAYIPLSQSDLADGESTGTFYFVAVEEKAGTASGGVTYGSAQLRAKVEVERTVSGDTYTIRPTKVTYSTTATGGSAYIEEYGELSDGTWGVTGTTGTKPGFSNSYAATGTATLDASKHIEGREWKTGESFTFTLTSADGPVRVADGDGYRTYSNSDPLTATATSADRIVDFTDIVFTQDDMADKDDSGNVTGYSDKTFTYTIHEVVPDGATNASVGGGATTYAEATDAQKATTGWTYEGLTYAADKTVKVNVHEKGDGTLRVTYGDEGSNTPANPQFDNSYTTGDTTAEVAVRKQLSGRPWTSSDSYTFTLTRGTNTAGDSVATPMPLDASGNEVNQVTVTINSDTVAGANGVRQKGFGSITYSKPGIYHYTITEAVPDAATATVGGQTVTYGNATDEQKSAASGSWTLNGVTYDGASHDATVTVTDNMDGTLSASVVYGATGNSTPATFDNTYAPSDTSITLKATKALTGRSLSAGEFNVGIYEVNPTSDATAQPVATMANDASGAFTSRPLTLTKEDLNADAQANTGHVYKKVKASDAELDQWTVYYYLQEVNAGTGGFTYDGTIHTVQVTVTDNGVGGLTATATYDGGATAPAFSNSYAATGTAALDVSKHISGREWKTGESFTFTLTGADGAPVRTSATDADSNQTLTATVTTTNRTVDFANLVFTQDDLADKDESGAVTGYSDKTFTYTIHEQCLVDGVDKNTGDGTYKKDGLTYAADQTTIVNVHDNGQGQLVVTYGEDGTNTPVTPEFYNTYQIETGTTAKLGARKQLSGRPWLSGDSFEFTLEAVSNTAVGEDGGAVETPMPEGEGTKATVTSSSPNVGDPATAKSCEFGEIAFTRPGTYTYTITETVPADTDGLAYDTATHDAVVTVTDNLDGTLSASVRYGATQSAEPATFTNSYTTTGVTFALSASKSITGKALGAGEYAVDVYDVDPRTDQSASYLDHMTNTAAGSFTSDTFTFTRAQLDALATSGEAVKSTTNTGLDQWSLTYWLREANAGQTVGGVTNDASVHKATVTVTDNGKGALVSAVTYNDSSSTAPVVSNTYNAAGTATVRATKGLTGRAWHDNDSFTFKIAAGSVANADASDTATPSLTTAPLVASGTEATATKAAPTASFPALNYKLSDLKNADGTYSAKTFDYTISEVEGAIGGIAYTTDTVTAHVTVRDAGNGTLMASVTYGDQAASTVPTITNTYTATDITATIQTTKAIDGREWTDEDSFTFQLTAVNGAPLRTAGGASATAAANSSSKTATFPTLTYTFTDLAGAVTKTFAYTISEVAPTDDDLLTEGVQHNGVTYTTEEHTAYVTLTDNGNGTMSTSVAYDAGHVAMAPIFTNSYAPKGATAVIKASKVISGRSLANGEFTLTGSYAGGSKAQVFSVANSGSGFTSPELAYDPDTLAELVDGGEAVLSTENNVSTWTIAYELKETLPEDDDAATAGVQKDGVTYDETTHTATVTVTDDGSGKLQTSVTYDDDSTTAPTISNAYAANGTAQVTVTKALTGRSINEGEFSFALYRGTGTDASLIDTASVAVDGSVTFDELTYTLDDLKNANGTYSTKTFDYTVTEVMPTDDDPDKAGVQHGGVTYDGATHIAHVKVSDGGKGKLVTSVTYDGGFLIPATGKAPAFTNSYTASGTAELQATKALTGRSWLDGESYTFKVAAGGVANASAEDTASSAFTSAPLRASGTVATATEESQTASFPQMAYTLDDLKNVDGTYSAKMFDYTITETMPADDDSDTAGVQSDGVTYDGSSHTAHVTVSDKGDGTLSTTVTYDDDATVAPTFTNPYAPKAATATLHATKDLAGRALMDGEFTLTGNYAGGSKAQVFSVTNSDGGFTSPALTYDTATLDTLTSGGEAVKAVEGSTTTWTITYVLAETLPADDDTATAGVQKDGVTYDGSTHTATVTVTDDGSGQLQASVVYDNGSTTAPTFDNAYGASGVAQVTATKALAGRSLKAGDFTFELYEGSNTSGTPLRTADNTADGTVTFAPLTYTIDDLDGAVSKTFDYTIVEQLPEDDDPSTAGVQSDGVTYDGSTHTVHITITEAGSGKLSTVVTCDDDAATAPTFSNSYKASGSAMLSAYKTLNGQAPDVGRFSFQLYEGNPDQGGTLLQTVSNGEGGTVSFDPITYNYNVVSGVDNTGEHVYTIREVAPEGATVNSDGTRTYANMTYTADKTVTVKVSDAGDGTLDITYNGAEELTPPAFENKNSIAPASARLSAHKTLEGAELAEGQFTFVLIGPDGSATELTNDADGTIELPKWSYDEPGTWTYTLSEIDGGVDGYTYDDTVYTITVTVADDGNGSLSASTSVSNGSSEVATDGMVFTNSYNPPPEEPGPPESSDVLPKSGDPLGSLAIPLLALILGAGLGIGQARRRMRDDVEDHR